MFSLQNKFWPSYINHFFSRTHFLYRKFPCWIPFSAFNRTCFGIWLVQRFWCLEHKISATEVLILDNVVLLNLQTGSCTSCHNCTFHISSFLRNVLPVYSHLLNLHKVDGEIGKVFRIACSMKHCISGSCLFQSNPSLATDFFDVLCKMTWLLWRLKISWSSIEVLLVLATWPVFLQWDTM